MEEEEEEGLINCYKMIRGWGSGGVWDRDHLSSNGGGGFFCIRSCKSCFEERKEEGGVCIDAAANELSADVLTMVCRKKQRDFFHTRTRNVFLIHP